MQIIPVVRQDKHLPVDLNMVIHKGLHNLNFEHVTGNMVICKHIFVYHYHKNYIYFCSVDAVGELIEHKKMG